MHTCQQWIDEYNANKQNRQVNSTYNNRKVYNPMRGELSPKMASEEIGLGLPTIWYHIKQGNLKASRKGTYHVIMRDDLENFKAQRGITDVRKIG